jgi:hypothetical protein
LPSDTYLRNGVNITIFIDYMQKNFILTDIMKTGQHQDLEDFISMHSLENQSFDMTGEYFTLHNYDLDSYDRRFAILDLKEANLRFTKNEEFYIELHRRVNLLKSQGFVFIKATTWESLDTIKKNPEYPMVEDLEHVKWSGGISWFWYYMYKKHKDKKYEFDHNDKPYDFLYLNKLARGHRQTLFKEVEPLLNNSLYSNWDKGIKLPKEYELPWAQDYPRRGLDQDIYEKPYNHTKFSLVSETNDTNNEVFMTEKIWKAIMAKHVFVVHGNFLYLQKLRELGFKTFGAYFDESYDLEIDQKIRIEKIANTCQQLLKSNWKDIYQQTKALRQHNHDLMFDKDKLSEEINKTLNLFLEFADGR